MSGLHALPDVIAPNLRIIFCGTAAGARSAASGCYYAGPGNSFWKTLHEVGLTPRLLAPEEFKTLPRYGIGLTDIAKYRAGNDDVLEECDFDVPAFIARIRAAAPRAIAFNGKRAAAVYFGCGTKKLTCGLQPQRIDATSVWILPSTSASARAFCDITCWKAIAAFASGAK